MHRLTRIRSTVTGPRRRAQSRSRKRGDTTMDSNYDVVVIGSGVAGALVAWKLAKAGSRVLIIDAGTKQNEKQDREKFVTTFTQALQRNKTPCQPYQPTKGPGAGKVL